MNVILTGMRGTGKSSIGKLLAGLLGFAFIDTDAAIETLAGVRIADLVACHGWEHFRGLERQVVAHIATGDRQVIATGGGTLIDEANAKQLKACGVVVLLLCAVPILQRRLGAGENRPSLTGQGSAVAELEHVWNARQARYLTVADLSYDVSAESANSMQDLRHKAQAIQELLRQTMSHQRADQPGKHGWV